MGYTSYTDGPRRSFAVATPGLLDGKQDLLVELDLTTKNGIKLLATPGNEIGTVFNELQPGAKSVTITRFNTGPTHRMKQSGAIPKGTRVVADPANLGQVMAIPAAAGTYRTIGRKLSEGPGQAGEIIETDGVLETVTK